MGFYVGIDLGTTNSTVSVIRTEDVDDNPLDTLETCPIYQYGKSIDNYLMGEKCLPSALYFDVENKRVYTGQYAREMYSSGDRPMQTIKSIKLHMGGESVLEVPGIEDPMLRETFTMEQCASLFIRTILNSLQEQFPEVPDIDREVVVTVPTAFSDDERVATRNAVLLGGFKSCIILDEPTAALLSYLNEENYDDSGDNEHSHKLVYDIGGGTLDVSIAKVSMNDEGNYEIVVKGLSERMDLGGDNFDRLLGAYFLKEFEASEEVIEKRSLEDQNRIIARIVSNAEDEKIQLNNAILACDSPRKMAKCFRAVAFELINGMHVNGISVDKSMFDDLFLEFTHKKSGSLLRPINMALHNAKLSKADIDEVILTGGMSGFYAVREAIESYFGDIKISMVEDTRTAVSRGAALYHWGLDENNESLDAKRLSAISNRLASNYYLRRNNNFELLIPDNLAQKAGAFTYVIEDENMTSLPIFIYSGNEETEKRHSRFTPLKGKRVSLKRAYRKGEVINLTWSMDENKVITIGIEEEGLEPITISRYYPPERIQGDPIRNYRINRD